MGNLKIIDFILIALVVLIFQVLFDFGKSQLTKSEDVENRDTITIYESVRSDSIILIEKDPVYTHRVYRDSFVQTIVLPGEKDTAYIVLRDTIESNTEPVINLYQDSIINKMMYLKYTAATYGKLLYWNADDITVYPTIEEKHIYHKPLFTVEGMAGALIGEESGPAIGGKLSIGNWGGGAITSKAGTIYFGTYKRSF